MVNDAAYGTSRISHPPRPPRTHDARMAESDGTMSEESTEQINETKVSAKASRPPPKNISFQQWIEMGHQFDIYHLSTPAERADLRGRLVRSESMRVLAENMETTLIICIVLAFVIGMLLGNSIPAQRRYRGIRDTIKQQDRHQSKTIRDLLYAA